MLLPKLERHKNRESCAAIGEGVPRHLRTTDANLDFLFVCIDPNTVKREKAIKKNRTELVTTPPWWFFLQGCPGERLQPAGYPTHGHKILLRRQVPLPLLLNPTGGAGHPRLLQQPAQTPEKSVR